LQWKTIGDHNYVACLVAPFSMAFSDHETNSAVLNLSKFHTSEIMAHTLVQLFLHELKKLTWTRQ